MPWTPKNKHLSSIKRYQVRPPLEISGSDVEVAAWHIKGVVGLLEVDSKVLNDR